MNRQTILLSALAAVLVIALWWLFLYTPAVEELAEVETEIVAAEAEQVSLEQRIVALEAVRARASETEAALARVEGLLPLDPALPGAFRQLEASAEDAGVAIRAMSAQRPVAVDELTQLHQIELTLNVEGSYFQIVDFVRRVEDPTVTARAIEFTSLAMALDEYPTLTASLSARMYAVLDPVPVPSDEEEPVAATPPADSDTEQQGDES